MHYIETKHTCLRDQIIPHYRQAGAKALCQILRTRFALVDYVYQPNEIIINIINKYKINISYVLAWWVRNYALQALRGNEKGYLCYY